MTTYSSLTADHVARLRTERRNHNGTPAAAVVASGGEPVRCCMTDARPGEALLLASVDVGLPARSPYAVTSPVYAHAEEGCRTGASSEYPPAWVGRRQVLRAYDERGWIVATALHESDDPGAEVERLLDRPGVAQVLSSNVAHGCYMLTGRTG